MEYRTMLAIILILGGLTGMLYWATFAPDFLNETFDMGCDPNANSMGCTAVMSIGYFILFMLMVGGAIGIFAGRD
jgi:hypothetical protein